MLAKINSIKKDQDFQQIFKTARKAPQSLKNNLFIFKTRKNGLEINRFAFIVSQKVSKKATIRNKVRRRLSEAVKSEIGNIKKGLDLVLIALPGIEKKEFSEIKETIKDTLVKAGLLDS